MEGLFPKEVRSDEIKNEEKKWENEILGKDSKFEANRYIWFSAIWNYKVILFIMVKLI